MTKLEIFLRDASAAYIEEKKHAAATHYKAALDFIADNHLQDNVVNKDVIRYIISLAALESKNVDDLNNAVSTLHALEKSMGSTFPAVYYALGKANFKQFRFDEADEAIKEGFAFLNSDKEPTVYYIPGTYIVLPESTREGLLEVLMQLKEECSGWHRPDAICNSPNCQNFTQTHSVQNRKIFFGDPAFTGMMRVTCNNCTNPCKVNFHQICWKTIKEQLSPIKKLSDKDVIGCQCFTPNCENENIPSIIIKIEVIGENAEVKTVMEGSAAVAQPVKPHPVAKGAIRKQNVQPKEKKRFEKPKKPHPVAQQPQHPKEHAHDSRPDLSSRVMDLIELRENNFLISTEHDWRPDCEMYGNLNLTAIGEAYPDPDFSASEPEIGKLQSFTFSMLYEYIVNNGPVKVKDVLQKWEETKVFLPTSVNVIDNDIEIIDFLLQSLKVTMIGDYICTAKMLPHVYRSVKENTSACLKFALEKAIEPDEMEVEDDDVFNQLMQEESDRGTLKVSNENVTSLASHSEKQIKKTPAPKKQSERVKPPKIKKVNKPKVKSPEQEPTEDMFAYAQRIYEQSEFYNQSLQAKEIADEPDRILDFEVEVPDHSLDNSTSREIVSFNQGSQIVHNTAESSVSQANTVQESAIVKSTSEEELKRNKLIEDVRLTVKNFFKDFDKTMLRKRKGDGVSPTRLGPEGDGSFADGDYLAIADNSRRESISSQENIPEILGESVTMDNEVYKQYAEHIAQLNVEIQSIARQKMLAEQKIGQLLQEKGNLIKTFETERNSMLQEINAYNSLASTTKDVQMRYESQVKDYAKLQQDTISVIGDKRELEQKLQETIEEKNKLVTITKNFDKENLLLRAEIDQISKELQSKTTDLEKEQEAVLELKQTLLQKSLSAQFIANKNLLTGYVEQCNLTLEVFKAANAFLKNALNITLFPEAIEWANTLSELKAISNDHQAEFSRLFGLLQSKDEVKSIEDVNLKLQGVPAKPPHSLPESVHRAFSVIHMHFMKMMPRLPNIPPPQPMMHSILGQPMYIQNPQQQYVLNPGYQYPRNRMPYPPPQQPIPPQPLMNFNFPRPGPPSPSPSPINNGTNKISNSVFSSIVKVADESEKKEQNGSRDDSEHSNDVSLDEVIIEEKEKLSDISSIEGSTTSLSMKSETAPTPPLNGLQLKKPKYGIDRVMQKLRSEFVGVPELDLIECISDIRKMHNNTLNGMRTSEIIKEAKQFILKRQRQHICDYTNGNIQSDHKEEKYENAEASSKEKSVETKDYFHPFAFERLSAMRNRQNSVSSTSSVGSVPNKYDTQPTKKAPTKPAWVPIKTSDNKWKKEAQEAECNICMDPLENTGYKKAVYTLRCQHSFHTECIRNWFRQSQSCPTCRVFSTLDDDFPPLPS